MEVQGRKAAIIGAGPIGLEAGHALARWGFEVEIFEAGASVGTAIRKWSHVRFFSPWKMNVSPTGLEALAEMGLDRPDEEAFPRGEEFVERYLEPLAAHERLAGRIRLGWRVRSAGREGVLKGEWIGSNKRKSRPFRLLVEGPEGEEEIRRVDLLIDASGTYEEPNHLGSGGIAAPGERRGREKGVIDGYIPDLRGERRREWEGRHIAVIGSGYSAITSLRELLKAVEREESTKITWITRGEDGLYERLEGDPLPQRDELARLGNELAGNGGGKKGVEHIGGVEVEEVKFEKGGRVSLVLRGQGERRVVEGVERIVANVGYRPNLELCRELQVHQCYASEGPMKLAAALLGASGGGGGDCLAQGSMGAETLKSPEPDFYILGAKSYGRRSDFLLKLGLEQLEELKSLLKERGDQVVR